MHIRIRQNLFYLCLQIIKSDNNIRAFILFKLSSMLEFCQLYENNKYTSTLTEHCIESHHQFDFKNVKAVHDSAHKILFLVQIIWSVQQYLFLLPSWNGKTRISYMFKEITAFLVLHIFIPYFCSYLVWKQETRETITWRKKETWHLTWKETCTYIGGKHCSKSWEFISRAKISEKTIN